MEAMKVAMPVIIYVLLAILIISLIVLVIRLIVVLDSANKLVKNLEEEFEIDLYTSRVDTVQSSITSFSEPYVIELTLM